MEEEELVEIFKLRRSPHLTSRDIDFYLTETQLRTSVPRDELVMIILEITKTYNYANTIPKIWMVDTTPTRISTGRDVSKEDLLDSYISGCQQHSKLNELILPRKEGLVRICSYNIHYWTNPTTKYINIDPVLEAIDKIAPDIAGFQEALLPYNPTDRLYIDPEDKHAGYKVNIQTTTTTKISEITERRIESEDDWEMEDILGIFEDRDYGYRSQCMGSSTQSGESTYFGNLIVSKLLMTEAKGITLAPAKRGYGLYGRCATFGWFVSPRNQKFIVCNLHLDVFDETGRIRLREINQVIDYLDREPNIPTVVMGDFNALDKDDYTEQEIDWLIRNHKGHPLDFQVIDRMKEAGFHDVFGKGMFKYSSWTARRVDFIFVRNIAISKIKGTGVMYTHASDHLPIFVDIEL